MSRILARFHAPALCAALALAACGDKGGDPKPDGGADASSDAAADAGADAAPDGGNIVECPQAQRDFTVYDLTVMPPSYPTKTFRCVAPGRYGVVWVEESIWETEMSQAEADAVLAAFDESTLADPARGIYELTTSTFGEPTDVDQNGQVFLLFYRLGSYASSEFDGFIRREDVLGGANSNQAEILYLDGVRNDPASEYVLGVVAHEFQHLIHVAYDRDEAGWVEECLSEAAMVLGGYMGDLEAWVPSWVQNPNRALTTEPPGFHYGAGFLFGAYLLERYGPSFMATLVEEPSNGVAGVEAALLTAGETDDFGDLLGDWAMANVLDAPSLAEGQWGYSSFDVPPVDSFSSVVPSSAIPITVQPHGSYVISFAVAASQGTSVAVQMTSSAWQNLTLRWAALPQGSPHLATVGRFEPSDSTDLLTVPGLGGTVDRLIIVAVERGGVEAASAELQTSVP
ncbi:MAG: hypothetical protein RBU30_06890 [Polyangia bacterium]|jgi:hypothetical protein|nr:hypothetical protein [Polyangia bacterium]